MTPKSKSTFKVINTFTQLKIWGKNTFLIDTITKYANFTKLWVICHLFGGKACLTDRFLIYIILCALTSFSGFITPFRFIKMDIQWYIGVAKICDKTNNRHFLFNFVRLSKSENYFKLQFSRDNFVLFLHQLTNNLYRQSVTPTLGINGAN